MGYLVGSYRYRVPSTRWVRESECVRRGVSISQIVCLPTFGTGTCMVLHVKLKASLWLWGT